MAQLDLQIGLLTNWLLILYTPLLVLFGNFLIIFLIIIGNIVITRCRDRRFKTGTMQMELDSYTPRWKVFHM